MKSFFIAASLLGSALAAPLTSTPLAPRVACDGHCNFAATDPNYAITVICVGFGGTDKVQNALGNEGIIIHDISDTSIPYIDVKQLGTSASYKYNLKPEAVRNKVATDPVPDSAWLDVAVGLVSLTHQQCSDLGSTAYSATTCTNYVKTVPGFEFC